MLPLSRRHFLAAHLAAVPVAARGQVGTRPDTIRVPARAVTRGPKHHFFGYYDKTPWDQTGRYLLAHEVGFAAREPKPGETLTVGMVDLNDGDRYVPLDATAAWSWQQGAQLQWLGSAPDREIVYNSLADGKYVAVVRDVHSGKTRTLPRPVYTLSPDGKQTVTVDYARTLRLRPGYGYNAVPEADAADPAPDSGAWHMDMTTGAVRPIVSLKQLAANRPDERFAGCQHGIEHPTFNTDGTRVAFFHRWTKPGTGKFQTRVYAVKPDGTDLRLLLDEGSASHFDWRDPNTLFIWAKTKKAGNHFYLLDGTGGEPAVVGDGVLTQDGHCSYSPDRRWVLNDTYPDKDRLQWLMLFDTRTGRRYDLNQFRSLPQFTGPVRCDLHPRWDRTGTKVCIDGCHEPQRQMYVLDVSDVVKSV